MGCRTSLRCVVDISARCVGEPRAVVALGGPSGARIRPDGAPIDAAWLEESCEGGRDDPTAVAVAPERQKLVGVEAGADCLGRERRVVGRVVKERERLLGLLGGEQVADRDEPSVTNNARVCAARFGAPAISTTAGKGVLGYENRVILGPVASRCAQRSSDRNHAFAVETPRSSAHDRDCHAESRGFESLQPLSEKSRKDASAGSRVLCRLRSSPRVFVGWSGVGGKAEGEAGSV